MKLTVITKGKEEIVGYTLSHRIHDAGQPGQFRGGLLAGPGQQMHEVEVPDDFSFTPSSEEIHGRLQAILYRK